MKKKIILIIIMFLCCSIVSFASDNDKTLQKISKDRDIIEAVKIMNNPIGANSYAIIMGNNSFKKAVIIEFKDLKTIGSMYADYDALGYSDKKHLYIYINPKHRHEIPEALCSLLTGMAVYNDNDVSKLEISYANALEGASWGYFEDKKPQLKLIDSALIRRESSLMKIYKASPEDTKYVLELVENDSRYSGLKLESKEYSYAGYRLKTKVLYDLYKKYVKEPQTAEKADINSLYKLYADNVAHETGNNNEKISESFSPKTSTVSIVSDDFDKKYSLSNDINTPSTVFSNTKKSTPCPSLSTYNGSETGSSRGSRGRPGIDAAKEPDFGPYMKDMQRRIKYNWHPPKGNESRKVVLLFKIAKNGQLLSCKVYKSSGSESADQAALNAVKMTAPFRPLPSDYKGKEIDIQFTFDYNVFGASKE